MMPRIITRETLERSIIMDSLQKAVDDFESDLPFGDEVRLVIKTKDDKFQVVKYSGREAGLLLLVSTLKQELDELKKKVEGME